MKTADDWVKLGGERSTLRLDAAMLADATAYIRRQADAEHLLDVLGLVDERPADPKKATS